MSAPRFFILCSLVALSSGCLNFGSDTKTNVPTEEQISQCRALLHLNPDLQIDAKGYAYYGTGIDDLLVFKFETNVTTPDEIFDTEKLDITSLKDNYKLPSKFKDLAWWDIEGKTFYGGQISLPKAKYLEIGIEKTDQGSTVYLFWFEV